MQKIKYKLTSSLRSALALNDDLGFDNAHLAAQAILQNDDYAQRWEIIEQAEVIEQWRYNTLSNINNFIS